MNLNYEALVVADTSNMEEEVWLEHRRKGIGGSDVAAVLECSPFKSIRQVYYEKIGIPSVNQEDHWVQFEVGHRLEELVARIFEKKTSYFIIKDEKMLAHPLFPFMQANVDYLYIDDKGEMGILECKTGSHYTKEQWSNDRIPFHYELQVRHYLAVLNLNTAWIACLCGNNETDFVMRKITRDLKMEQEFIENECYFWNTYVLPKIEPPFLESPSLGVNCLKTYFTPDKNDKAIEISNHFVSACQDYLRLRSEKAVLQKQIKEIEEQMEAVSLPVIDILKNQTMAKCQSGSLIFFMDYKLRRRTIINKDSLTLLKLEHPEIYEKYVTVTSSTVFSIKQKETKEGVS